MDGVSMRHWNATTEDGKETSKVETMSVVQSAPVNESCARWYACGQ